MKRIMGIGLLATIGLCGPADFRQLVGLYQSILSSEEDSRIPNREVLASQEMEDTTERLSAEEISVLLGLGMQCIHSPRQKIRESGLDLVLGISFRPDSTQLLGPYVDDLGRLLKQPDQPSRNVAIFILGNSLPTPSPKALLYLASHIRDKNASVDEIAGAAAGLLKPTHPLDPAALQSVLRAVKERGHPSLTVRILGQVGLFQITHEEALKFIKASLTDANPFVRREAVEASGRMSREVKAKFTPELLGVVQNPDETPETRSRAEQVLRE